MRNKSKLLVCILLVIGLFSIRIAAGAEGEQTPLVAGQDQPESRDCLDCMIYGSDRLGNCLWSVISSIPWLAYKALLLVIRGARACPGEYIDFCKFSPLDAIVATGCLIIIPTGITGIFVFRFKILPDLARNSNTTEDNERHLTYQKGRNRTVWTLDDKNYPAESKVEQLTGLLPADANYIQFDEDERKPEFVPINTLTEREVSQFARLWFVTVKNLKRKPHFENLVMRRFPDALLFCYALAGKRQEHCLHNISRLPLGSPDWQIETVRMMAESEEADVETLLNEVSFQHPVKINVPVVSESQ